MTQTLTLPNPANQQIGQISLSDVLFRQLADVPAEIEWFANLDNPQTRRAYQADIADFQAFAGIDAPAQFRLIARGHVLAWRKSLELRACSPATLRRKLAALSSLFEYLCERNAVATNPVKGVKRPKVESNEGKTPALSDAQARQLLAAPDIATLKGKRDRAILAVLLYHGLRRAELCSLSRRDIEQRRGVVHLRIEGKGSKIRYVPLHPLAAAAIQDYLDAVGERVPATPLFCGLRGDSRLSAGGVYQNVVLVYGKAIGVAAMPLFGPHVMRATAATNALDNGADIAKVQEWLGHANIQTTRLYDRRKSRPEDSPTFRVAY
jgi:site-specific recombinase XerD